MGLTPRQHEIAALVARGLSTKAIARELGIAPQTVLAHVRDAADRLPGAGRPRWKLVVYVLSPSGVQKAA